MLQLNGTKTGKTQEYRLSSCILQPAQAPRRGANRAQPPTPANDPIVPYPRQRRLNSGGQRRLFMQFIHPKDEADHIS
jgi:hypothetical protein